MLFMSKKYTFLSFLSILLLFSMIRRVRKATTEEFFNLFSKNNVTKNTIVLIFEQFNVYSLTISYMYVTLIIHIHIDSK